MFNVHSRTVIFQWRSKIVEIVHFNINFSLYVPNNKLVGFSRVIEYIDICKRMLYF